MIGKSLLDEHSFTDLQFSCGSDWRFIKDIGIKYTQDDVSKLAEIVLKFYGSTILEQKSFRELFLRTLSSTSLESLVQSYKLSVDVQKPVLMARILANRPWGTSSKLIPHFRNMGFTSDYFPVPIGGFPSREIIGVYKPLGKLFKYQEEVIDEVILSVNRNNEPVLVQLPTGSGKTRILMESVCHLKNSHKGSLSILWLAHSEELIEQAIDTFKNVWSVNAKSSISINRAYGKHLPDPNQINDAVTFGGLQKLSLLNSSSDLLASLKENISIVVVDEAHKVTAPTYSNFVNSVLKKSNAKLIGVSATPGRSYTESLENRNFAKFFNDNIISAKLGENPIRALQELSILAKVTRKVIATDVVITESTITKKTLSSLSISKDRNRAIVTEIKKAVEEGTSTLVFSCGIQHSRIICAHLAAFGIDSGYIDYSLSYSSRKIIIENFKTGKLKVLINYSVLTTGFDAPIIGAVIIARPTTSIILYSQMIGRGLRGLAVGGNDYIRVVDVKDNIESFGDLDYMYNYFSEYWAK